MFQKFIDEAIDVFRELPGHVGCDSRLLSELENEHGGEFPPIYRELMLLDSKRLTNMKFFVSPEQIRQTRSEAEHVIEFEEFELELKRNQCVFAWEYIDAFYYFEMVGDDNVPVWGVNYCGGFNVDGYVRGTPLKISDNIPEIFAKTIRSYLKITP